MALEQHHLHNGPAGVRELVTALENQGFTVEKTSGNHYKVFKAGANTGCVFLAYTPSDHRSAKNAISRLKKIGYVHHESQEGPKGKRRKGTNG